MPILYDNPKRGRPRPHRRRASRAYDLYGGPTIVVDFGTATTLEAISDKGEYLGGAILPGIEISLDALFGRAAALFRGRARRTPQRHRQEHGRVDPVRRDLRLRRAGRRHLSPASRTSSVRRPSSPPAASPGSSHRSAKPIHYHEPWLTLHGLRLIFEKNRP